MHSEGFVLDLIGRSDNPARLALLEDPIEGKLAILFLPSLVSSCDLDPIRDLRNEVARRRACGRLPSFSIF
jgi:hypothetical protein